jgi:hypothetical protein
MSLLKDIMDYTNAMSVYVAKIQYWRAIRAEAGDIFKTQARGALTFLQYLNSYLSSRTLWQSWSPAGVLEASQRLNVPPSKIACTNNHLESFNGRIKGKYYRPYQHSGRLPRIDVWILLLVTKVMLDFFREQQERQALTDHYANLCILAPLDSTAIATPSDSDLSNHSTLFDLDYVENGWMSWK